MAMEATVIGEGTMEMEEAVYPCKGCGEILEEGKAFELAGNRWHIDCFRCNSCHTLLNSDANLLLLGDGSLICNNCTYSCTVCQNKIEDLAILTGDQAFCAKCFKCRNCKRKIENLKYAKTSQGIFCMQCHESLMARRRKKSRQTATRTSSGASHQSAKVFDKSLPALPPHIPPEGAFSPGLSPDPDGLRSSFEDRQSFDTATEQFTLSDASDSVYKHSASPSTLEDDKENFLLTPRHFGDDFSTSMHNPSGADEFEVPLSLDTSPMPSLPARNRPGERANRDYFGMPNPSQTNFRDNFGDLLSSAPESKSEDHAPPKVRNTPHIAVQEKGRQGSADTVDKSSTIRRKESGNNTPVSTASSLLGGADRFRFSPSREIADPMQDARFKLQEVPKRRQSGQQSASPASESVAGHIVGQTRFAPPAISSPEYSPRTGPDPTQSPELSVPKRKISFKRSPLASPATGATTFERPARGDSIRQATQQMPTRKEIPNTKDDSNAPPVQATVGRQESTWTVPKAIPTSLAVATAEGVPARSPRRPLSNQAAPQSAQDSHHPFSTTFTEPREAPPVPLDSRRKQNESITSIQSDYLDGRGPSSPNGFRSPSIDQFGDMPREDEESETPGILRKMSKAVRHGRSHSDKIGSASPKWSSRGSRNASVDIKASDISSPLTATYGEGENVDLRNKLRYSQQRIAELEAEKLTLQEKFNGIEDIRQVNSELKQKRSTVAMLDTQRETVIRELEAMTEQFQKAKNTSQVLDTDKLRSDVMREFAQSMTSLKEKLFKDIEMLMARKNELTAEISQLIQMKDKGNQEYESLSSKNHQLAQHNSQIMQSIQDLYRQGKQPSTPGLSVASGPTANGLGIYSQHNKGPSTEHLEVTSRQQYDTTSQLSNDPDMEPAVVMAAPKIIDMRKGQQKKFWKKGRDAVTKNVSKGLKGAFGATQAPMQEDSFQESIPYANTSQGEAPTTGDKPFKDARLGPTPVNSTGTIEQGRGAWLRRDVPASKSNISGSVVSGSTLRPTDSNASSSTMPSTVPHEPTPPSATTTLFGSDLSARCEYEKSVVPHVVLSCINEVSARGLDQEGLYRKSGSSTQVKAIQQGFETSPTGEVYDISDPDLDVHAITGCLKQYFRRLPNPLITFECYDAFLDCAKMEGEDRLAKARRIRDVVGTLPKSHRETLEFLCFHLVKVMDMQGSNLMTPLNIAVVFAPTIMRPRSIEREMVDTAFQRNAVQTLLENYATVFEE